MMGCASGVRRTAVAPDAAPAAPKKWTQIASGVVDRGGAVMRALVVMLCACNQVYDLGPTTLQDARPIDAPARCLGELGFEPQLRQVVFRECNHYTFVNDRAVAACGAQFDLRIAEGDLDGPLVDVELTLTVPNARLGQPRLTPDGELFVIQRLPDGSGTASVYQRSEAGWTWSRDLPFVIGILHTVGVPSRGPRAHVIVNHASTFEEAIDDGNHVWSSTTYPATQLGVDGLGGGTINLSSDGLRAVFFARESIRYAVRSTIDEPFSGSVPIDAPPAIDPFLSEDCSRLYFSGLESIFYLQR